MEEKDYEKSFSLIFNAVVLTLEGLEKMKETEYHPKIRAVLVELKGRSSSSQHEKLDRLMRIRVVKRENNRRYYQNKKKKKKN